jgi:hypothetical protein
MVCLIRIYPHKELRGEEDWSMAWSVVGCSGRRMRGADLLARYKTRGDLRERGIGNIGSLSSVIFEVVCYYKAK